MDLEQRWRARTHDWLGLYGPPIVVAIVFLVFAVRLFGFISSYAVNIFFSDQWVFNDATLFQQHTLWEMFTWQHGPHRMGLGALFSKFVEPLFSWNSRTESFVVGAVIAVAAACALYLKKRLFDDISVFDVIVPITFFIPGQYETLFVTANFAHGPFPLLLILLFCLAWTLRNKFVRLSLILLINFLTIYTGFGLFLGLLTPILLVLDYRATPPEKRLPRGYLYVALLLSLVSVGSFFLGGYKFDPASSCFTVQPQSPTVYAAYAALMFANFFSMTGVGSLQLLTGTAALIALLVSLGRSVWQLGYRHQAALPEADRDKQLSIATLTAFCLLFCLGTAYGRLCDGLRTADASRYVIYLELGILGLYFQLSSIRATSIRRALSGGLLLAVLAASLYLSVFLIGYFPSIKRQWRDCYLQTENVNLCNQAVGFPIDAQSPENAHLEEKLRYLKKTGQNLYSDVNRDATGGQ